jgi:uncharacterized membrane protein
MSKCSVGDVNFDNVLKKLNLADPSSIHFSQQKKFLFYYVCIIVRLILFYLIYQNRNEQWLYYILFAVSSFAVYNLSSSINGNQWWSRKFQFIIALIVFICSATILSQQCDLDKRIIPFVLFFSLTGGIYQSLFVNWC